MLSYPAAGLFLSGISDLDKARRSVGLRGNRGGSSHETESKTLLFDNCASRIGAFKRRPNDAHGADLPDQRTLTLPELIQEALAKNPEIQAARKQWEASASRIAQARSLDDPTLQVQWWNAPESFNLGRSQNTIIGLSQKFPFPGKLSL